MTMILYYTGQLKFDVSSDPEFDFVAESLGLLALASELLQFKAANEETTQAQIARYLVQGVLDGLFFVAVKCQDHGVRWQAIQLLEQHSGIGG